MIEKINNITLTKVEYEHKAAENEEHVYILKSELDDKNITISDLTEKLEAKTREKDIKNHTINLLEKNIKILQDKLELL